MFDPVVRRATPTDVPELQLLESLARAGLVDARGGNRWLDEHVEIGEGWKRLVAGDDPQWHCFVAELDGVVIGYLCLVLESDRTARVDQVFVHPEARECGFGDALIEAATLTGREHGSVRIEGEALPGDRQTKNLYERAGITARLITVSALLG